MTARSPASWWFFVVVAAGCSSPPSAQIQCRGSYAPDRCQPLCTGLPSFACTGERGLVHEFSMSWWEDETPRSMFGAPVGRPRCDMEMFRAHVGCSPESACHLVAIKSVAPTFSDEEACNFLQSGGIPITSGSVWPPGPIDDFTSRGAAILFLEFVQAGSVTLSIEMRDADGEETVRAYEQVFEVTGDE